jgi:hypothetical protein
VIARLLGHRALGDPLDDDVVDRPLLTDGEKCEHFACGGRDLLRGAEDVTAIALGLFQIVIDRLAVELQELGNARHGHAGRVQALCGFSARRREVARARRSEELVLRHAMLAEDLAQDLLPGLARRRCDLDHAALAFASAS